MKRLRTLSASRLAGACLAAVAVVATGTTIALAGGGSGPVPAPKALDVAIRDALTAPDVPGVTARIKFVNNLIDGSSIQGSDPIISGADGRLWLSDDGRVRLELASEAGDAQLVSDGRNVSVYDAAMNKAWTATIPEPTAAEKREFEDREADGPPTLAAIREKLAELTEQADVSGARPGTIAGRPVYTVRLEPKHAGGLLGGLEVAWDAVRGVPLRVAVYAQDSAEPVLELVATDIEYKKIAASTFAVKPPADADTTVLNPEKFDRAGKKHAAVVGADKVAARLPFELSAPATLVGLPRQEVRLIESEGRSGALVTYGEGLGAIAVLQQPVDPKAPKIGAEQLDGEGRGWDDDHAAGLQLPTVSINGATGEELGTALGTMIRFARDGIEYTVVGSVPPAAAESAARGL